MNEIQRAARLIREGQLVAFPTETVYGLGANALDAAAVQRIFEAKGRPSTSPLIVHADSVEMAQRIAAVWPESAWQLAARFWPGPLTLVLPKLGSIPDIVTAGLPTVGIRVPGHPMARALIQEAGVPIAAPSANRFGELSPTTAAHVRQGLGDRVAMILDAGPTEIGIESTVLSLAGPQPILLRPGTVQLADLESAIGKIELGGPTTGCAHPSPGLHHRHYSPRTPTTLAQGGNIPRTGRGAYLWHTTFAPADLALRLPDRPGAYAACLYARLHEIDAQGWDWIAVESVPDTEPWAGIRDRLQRASSVIPD